MAKIYDFDEERNKDSLNKIEEIKEGYKRINDIENIARSPKLSDEEKIIAIQELFDIYHSDKK